MNQLLKLRAFQKSVRISVVEVIRYAARGRQSQQFGGFPLTPALDLFKGYAKKDDLIILELSKSKTRFWRHCRAYLPFKFMLLFRQKAGVCTTFCNLESTKKYEKQTSYRKCKRNMFNSNLCW